MNNDHLTNWIGTGFLGMLDRWGAAIRDFDEHWTSPRRQELYGRMKPRLERQILNFMDFLSDQGLEEHHVYQWKSDPWRLAIPKDGEVFMLEVIIQPTPCINYYRFLLGIDKGGRCSVAVYDKPQFASPDWKLLRTWTVADKGRQAFLLFVTIVEPRPSWGWM
jgi:hypothetical protein